MEVTCVARDFLVPKLPKVSRGKVLTKKEN
jgi:hypothetical protein